MFINHNSDPSNFLSTSKNDYDMMEDNKYNSNYTVEKEGSEEEENLFIIDVEKIKRRFTNASPVSMNFKIQKFEELRKRVTNVINKKEKKMSRRYDDRDNFDNLIVGKLFEKEEEEEEEERFIIDMNKLKEMPLPPTDVAPVPMEYVEEPKKKRKIKFEKMDKNILEDITFDDEHDFIDPTVEEQYAIEQNELKEMTLPPAADVASISMEYVEEPKKKKVKFGEGNSDVNNESELGMKDCLEKLENEYFFWNFSEINTQKKYE
jgi:hypothetical protein